MKKARNLTDKIAGRALALGEIAKEKQNFRFIRTKQKKKQNVHIGNFQMAMNRSATIENHKWRIRKKNSLILNSKIKSFACIMRICSSNLNDGHAIMKYQKIEKKKKLLK